MRRPGRSFRGVVRMELARFAKCAGLVSASAWSYDLHIRAMGEPRPQRQRRPDRRSRADQMEGVLRAAPVRHGRSVRGSLHVRPRHLASRDEQLHEQQRLVLQRAEPKENRRAHHGTERPIVRYERLPRQGCNQSVDLGPEPAARAPGRRAVRAFCSARAYRGQLLGEVVLPVGTCRRGSTVFCYILRTAGVLSGRSLGRSRWRRTMRGRKFGRTSRRDEHADVRTVRPYRDRREVTGGMLRPPARAGRATASIRPVSYRTRRHGRGWSKAGSADRIPRRAGRSVSCTVVRRPVR